MIETKYESKTLYSFDLLFTLGRIVGDGLTFHVTFSLF